MSQMANRGKASEKCLLPWRWNFQIEISSTSVLLLTCQCGQLSTINQSSAAKCGIWGSRGFHCQYEVKSGSRRLGLGLRLQLKTQTQTQTRRLHAVWSGQLTNVVNNFMLATATTTTTTTTAATTTRTTVNVWVENVLKNITTFLSWKCFYFARIKFEFSVFKYIVCTNKLLVQSLVYTYQKVVK